MLKAMALSLALICSAASAQDVTTAIPLDPGQIYNTGNLVQPTTTTSGSTWVNGVYQDQLTCFAAGNPGYCGPSAIVRPDGNINFSYGITDLYQVQSISSVLPNNGTGLRVNGYTYGFTAKNGNGWDNGQQDYLSAYVSFMGSDGKEAFYKNYDLNSKFNWTTFNWSETFATPFASKDLSTVRYGIVGYDTNYWAGPYGPEVQNVNFSLTYSVDPCAKDVLSSPTCPGYLDALIKLISTAPATVTDPIATTSVSPTSTTTVSVEPTTVVTTSTATVGQPSTVAPVVTSPTTNTTTVSSTVSNSQSKESAGTNNSMALSIISKNQERDSAALSVAQTATAQAAAAALQSQQEAATVAASAVSNSTAANIVNVSGQQFSGTGLRPTSTAGSMSLLTAGPTMPGIASSATALQLPTVSQTQATAGPTTFQESTGISTPAVVAPTPSAGTNSSAAQNYAMIPPNFLTDKTNPLTEIVEGKQAVAQAATVSNTGPVVNKNVNDNDIAGGVSINRMTQSPAGYGDYLSLALKDAAFYAPREVYRNQKNVDNARALRQLTNDARHRDMVEMQYVR